METLLQKGAKNAITQCIRLQPNEKIFIVTDKETLEVGNALKTQAEAVVTHPEQVRMVLIEDYLERPATHLPQQLVDDLKNFNPEAGIYAAQGKPGELQKFRSKLIDVFTIDVNCRYAHMISISKELMEDGMNQDYEEVYKVTHRVKNLVEKANFIDVEDKHGTKMRYELDNQNLRWVPGDGRIEKGAMKNLPSGETYTSPKTANGTFVAWILGDFFSEKYGELDSPVVVEVENGYITKIYPKNDDDTLGQQICKELTEYTTEYENGNRVGELGIGTLVGLDHFVGNLLQDEKFPGVHMAFGHSYPRETGQIWDAPSHVDIIAKDITITLVTIDAETGEETTKLIMNEGKYIDEILN